MYPIGTALGVDEFFYTHVGTYYGNGMVFHNHWRNDADIVTLEEFANGKAIAVLSAGVSDLHGFYARVRKVLSERRAYDFLTNNCEHTASFVRGGLANSPQLAYYGLIGLLVGVIALSRGVRA